MASKKRTKKTKRATPQRKARTMSKTPVGMTSDSVGASLVVPEKRNTNFFSRIKKSNVQFAKQQAKSLGVCHSEYVDLLIEREKSNTARAQA